MIINFIQEMSNKSVYQIIAWFFAIFAKLAPISALVLFYSVAWQSAAFYGDIRQDVERNLTKVKSEIILKWKRSLYLADEIVDRINDCFGLIVLVSIAHFSVEFIARSFYLVNHYDTIRSITRNKSAILAIVNVLPKIFFIWFLAYCPEKIHHNVSCFLIK